MFGTNSLSGSPGVAPYPLIPSGRVFYILFLKNRHHLSEGLWPNPMIVK